MDRVIPPSQPGSILYAYRGSIAHGMYVPNTDPNSIDDIDLIDVVAPGESHYFGLKEFGSSGTKEIKDDPYDIVAYEVRKVVRMLANANPNILSLLWLREDHYLGLEAPGRLLIENRELFSSQRAYKSFAGYANGQLQKLEHGAFKGYMGDKRKALVEKYGYDPKMAAHLIRLLRMGGEFLRTGELKVFRDDDVDELLAIKRGEFELNRIRQMSDKLFADINESRDLTVLPDEPDMDAINSLCVEIVREALA